jgi:hypothetical protein
MDLKSTSILGVCIIIAAIILSRNSPLQPDSVQAEHTTQPVVSGRFHVSNPGAKGMTYVIDTVTGRVWREVVNMSGTSDGNKFYQEKLKQD